MIVLVAQFAVRRLHLCGDFVRANAIMGINLATTAVARRRADALAYLRVSLSSGRGRKSSRATPDLPRRKIPHRCTTARQRRYPDGFRSNSHAFCKFPHVVVAFWRVPRLPDENDVSLREEHLRGPRRHHRNEPARFLRRRVEEGNLAGFSPGWESVLSWHQITPSIGFIPRRLSIL